jgi:hypothetical protein
MNFGIQLLGVVVCEGAGAGGVGDGGLATEAVKGESAIQVCPRAACGIECEDVTLLPRSLFT